MSLLGKFTEKNLEFYRAPVNFALLCTFFATRNGR